MEDREAWGASPWGRKELDTATEQQTPSCNKQVVRRAVEPQHYMTLHDVQVPMAISQKQKKARLSLALSGVPWLLNTSSDGNMSEMLMSLVGRN